MYALIKDFAGALATILAAATAAVITYYFNKLQIRIAQTQADIATERLKLDLFERRYAIYLSARQLIEYLALQRKFDEVDRAKVKSLYVTLDEARFFLPVGVRNFLEKIDQTSDAFLQVLAHRSNLNVDDQEEWQSTADKAAALNARLQEMYADLPRAFEEALAFKQIERG